MAGLFVLVLTIPAQSQIRKVRRVKYTSDAELLRRKAARELVDLGFILTRDFGKAQLYEHWDANSGYIYQVWLKGKESKTIIDGYAFLKEGYKWAWRIGDDEAATYITNIVNYCIREGGRNEKLSPYVRERYRYHEMGIHKYTSPTDTTHY